jgi:hypothetical protein
MKIDENGRKCIKTAEKYENRRKRLKTDENTYKRMKTDKNR